MNVNFDALKIVTELGEAIRLQNEALDRLRAFRAEMPYAVAPNIARMVEENLKENIHVLYKEMNQAHKPPSERRRNVCKQCHMVFASPLPGGLCDECRNKPRTQPSAYGVWPVTPESETITASDAQEPDDAAAELSDSRSDELSLLVQPEDADEAGADSESCDVPVGAEDSSQEASPSPDHARKTDKKSPDDDTHG